MAIFVYIIGDSEVDVWGLSGRERLQRMLRTFKEQIILVNELNNIQKGIKGIISMRRSFV